MALRKGRIQLNKLSITGCRFLCPGSRLSISCTLFPKYRARGDAWLMLIDVPFPVARLWATTLLYRVKSWRKGNSRHSLSRH